MIQIYKQFEQMKLIIPGMLNSQQRKHSNAPSYHKQNHYTLLAFTLSMKNLYYTIQYQQP